MAIGHAHPKLTPIQIAEIHASKERSSVLAARYGVQKTTIWRHRNGAIRDAEEGVTERQMYRRVKQREAGRRARAERELELRRRLRAEVAAITWRKTA